MKVLIVSDTHRREENLLRVLELEKDVNRVIHLGDAEESESDMQRLIRQPLDIVCGNNDYLRDMPKEKDITIGRYRALLTHGHYYYVSLDTSLLEREARARGFDIAMYGHTHRPRVEQKEGLTLLNPGSLSYPRQEGRRPSYIVMELGTDGEARYEVRYL